MAERCAPILPSRDLGETLEFYERLGFGNRGAPPEEWDYLMLEFAVVDRSGNLLRVGSSV